jgi:putative transposase
MEQQTTSQALSSSLIWERLEAFVREQVQRFIQAVLAEEITALLGRPQSTRRGAVDAPPGMRNGYGKPRRLSLTSGTITVRRPRVRGLGERFVRRVLPLFQRRTRQVGGLAPALLAWFGPGQCRVGPARAAGRGGSALGRFAGAAEGQLAAGI